MENETKKDNNISGIEETSFFKYMLSRTPSWAIGFIGTLFVAGIVLKILGIDFSNPVNELSNAYAKNITNNTQNAIEFKETLDKLSKAFNEANNEYINQMEITTETLIKVMDNYSDRLDRYSRTQETIIISLEEIIKTNDTIEDRLLLIENRIENIENSHK